MRAAVMLLLAAACTRATDGAAPTAVVAQGDVVDRVLLTGAVHPTNAIDLSVPATDESSLAIRWIVADGTIVKAGDRVLELDATPFTDRLREGRTQLERSEAQFKLARRADAVTLHDKAYAVRQREIDLEQAKLKAGVPAELVTGREAQSRAMSLAQAEQELRKAKQDLAATRIELALEQDLRTIDLDKTRRTLTSAEHSLAMLQLVAPRSGVVAIAQNAGGNNKPYRVGDRAEVGQVVLSQPDLEKPMEVRAELIDIDDGRIGAHAAGTCTLDAYPAEPMPCTVIDLAPVARHTEGHDSLRRSFEVTLSLAGSNPAHLRPGMSVKVELAHTREHGLIVPRAALIARSHVLLATGALRDVTLGACDARRCIVAGGLVAGDEVAVGGAL